MNDLTKQAIESGLVHKVLKSDAEKFSVPTHAALRKVHKRFEGESRSQWDKRIDKIHNDLQGSMDVTTDAMQSDGIRRGMYWKSVTRKPNGDVVYVQSPPKADDTLAKKLAARAKLDAEIAELQSEKSETQVIEIVA